VTTPAAAQAAPAGDSIVDGVDVDAVAAAVRACPGVSGNRPVDVAIADIDDPPPSAPDRGHAGGRAHR
jgi:hypothetical protein